MTSTFNIKPKFQYSGSTIYMQHYEVDYELTSIWHKRTWIKSFIAWWWRVLATLSPLKIIWTAQDSLNFVDNSSIRSLGLVAFDLSCKLHTSQASLCDRHLSHFSTKIVYLEKLANGQPSLSLAWVVPVAIHRMMYNWLCQLQHTYCVGGTPRCKSACKIECQ